MSVGIWVRSFGEALASTRKIGNRLLLEREINRLSEDRAKLRQRMLVIQAELEKLPK